MENGLGFSPNKCAAIHFCQRRKCVRQLIITLKNNMITTPNTIKYLELTFDRKMSWKNHIGEIKIKCHTRLNIHEKLAHSTYGADCKSVLRIYVLIQSKIEYGAAKII